MKRVLPLLLAASLGSAVACTPAQSSRNARTVAREAARQKLGVAAFVYQFRYANVRYDVQAAQPSIKGNRATVRGTLTLKATEKSSGKPVQGTYRGTVTLGKVGTCGWKVTGYKQD